ncbi:family 65 glycosyl hydrolase domain-containing protein [Clostridium estertheticum]|uniref:Maltose phosphorylase n=1 Tax=Clostridium estertheticum subsp. estertheticum TaxID=1552 RepID=A0A1J0GDC9_9CLOT|nr:family 65 glycosyl hydrolase domain-containing protein [Clostridium estertheticum]APC39364.1 maltose phosphorylase [Clostridium estertheticum subsp. estertheticum]MBZ9614620.1 glycoside hydrolase family 65 protein [Clostridium estertheticum subsp. laramiense]WAG74545.1 glycoside hydrolase family 65 protein [Clostridium estertheticum]
MKHYYELDEWNIIEKGFNACNNEISESIFSLGNGFMGQRANFEEAYSGNSLSGNYIAGVYYPDKTRVGWWKNGYPEYFAKVLNSTNWIGINIKVNDITLDLAKCSVREFKRVLNMKEGYLKRSFVATLENGNEIEVNAKRFISMTRSEIGVIKYSIRLLNFSGKLEVSPYLDGNVVNCDSNYDETFWDETSKGAKPYEAYVMLKTKKLDFHVCTSMTFQLTKNGEIIKPIVTLNESEKYVSNTVSVDCYKNDELVIYKYVANSSSRYYKLQELIKITRELASIAKKDGFEMLLEEQSKSWSEKWRESDIVIKGDVSAQQGIRFNIFQLNQTYTGEDYRLNIGPKGFTGEKYGGGTYWDTEAYCIPFYLSTAKEKVSKNLLLYRYNQLGKAIENAKKLGFKDGAALYPMVTMNGEECHNEWEITFEEIHRNGAIAYAIYNYVNYTGDKSYLYEFGLEVLIAISRFWAQRATFSSKKNKYVILGVTGPNEYENNVNNNWYTNKIACWTMQYTLNVINSLNEHQGKTLDELKSKVNFKDDEIINWKNIIKNMYYPLDEELGIFLQQDGYMDKEQILVKDLDKKNIPINQNWSWDRILRSCFIKQADVLQGIYLFEQEYDMATIKRNFDFYEPRTVHESSLSPCIHTILAAKIGNHEKAYDMYLRASRLDLDNYNNDTKDGCHTTSMAGTWMAVVHGFGGLRVINNKLILNPFIPDHWCSCSFKIMFRGALLNIKFTKETLQIQNENEIPINLSVHENDYYLNGNGLLEVKLS